MNHPELIPYAGTFGESMISWTVVESGRALPPPAQPALSKNGIPHARMAEGRRKVNMFPTLFSCFATTLLCIVGLVVNVYGLSSSDLIFYLPFDGTLAPGYSAGEGKYSLTGSTISAVSFERGIKGQALSAGMKDYRYIFPSAGNINPQEGTLSFWVKPLDWEPAQEDLPAQHAFFGLWGNDEYVLLYKYFGAVKYLVKKGNRTWMLEWWPSDWKKGEWRHFALTWKGGLHRFHVNGKLVGELPDVAWAENLPAMLITSLAYNTSSDKPSTAFDELKIFNRFFSEGEIRILMARDQGGYNPPDLTIPLAQSRPIRIDGRIDTREWDGAVQTTGFITLFTQGWAKEQPRVWLAADTEKMYVAWQWDHGAEPLSQDMIGRDSAVYMDDSFEFWIDPRGTGAPATLVQFIGNARGSIYDSLNGNAAWNGKWEYQCRDEAGVWSAELAIAWRDLSGAPPNPPSAGG